MSMNESRSIHAAEDWGVVLQSVPSRNKREIVKRLEEVFELDKRDAEQVLSNMPLILIDNLSFGLAARIKNFFQKIGAVAETTNHDMIKKNCFQVLWPQTPDLSFFMKNEIGPVEASVREERRSAGSEEIPPVEKNVANYEMKMNPEMPRIYETPLPAKPIQESPAVLPLSPPTPVKPIPEPPASVSLSHPVSEEKPAAPLSSGVDSDWERRARELNEKLQKIHDEKQELHVQHAEATEKVKSEFQQRIEEEKKKSGEIAKAYEDLQKEAQKHEALTREGEEWRSRAAALDEKVRELEASLVQKTSAVEHVIQEKDELIRKSEKVATENQHELTTLRSREQEFSRKIEGLERNVQEMAESLRSRDGALAQFERQILELAEKAQGYESLRQEHEQLSQERATIRQEYDSRLVEQEVRLAKVEEDHRRYRSRTDRKNAAATRELGEWIRGVDTIRQGLQKLILFLGSESAVLDSEKKSTLRSPLTRGPDAPNTGKI
ncbi:MAG: hypothetical protein A2351_01425 [Omnitrophica bacterium RIFOXYB12_FULL_50_7]|nr:MAG: hypothetical protein A2351_01425 [Omnitrophica bacterium RIFOXYB12_FULL_50_7]